MSPNSPRVPLRRQVTVPGILRETIQRRMAEFSYKSFSPFAVELVCFDLRKRREHLVTRPFADEPSAVQDALDRLMEHRTTIVIAHRLATVRAANRIVVMDQGRVVDIGLEEQYKASATIFAEGSPGDKFYLIVEGAVRISRIVRNPYTAQCK